MVTVLQNMMDQARGQVLSKTPEGRMKEEQRLKINQGVQSGESLLRAETCLDKMTICQMTASGPVRFSQPPSPLLKPEAAWTKQVLLVGTLGVI